MTTIRQLIQTSPAKANEIFAKLVDTSETAVKTRDRLFADLKVELELLAKLEEQHLFPVLKKHKATKNLVLEALDDNRQTRKLLAELDRTPKDSEDFATKVADLRKVFQQHVRDDRNELLPAVLKALSDEEADAVVGKIEDEKAEIEAARRAEAEERRAEARREREEVEAVHQTAKDMANTVRAGAEGVEQIARTAQESVRNGLGTAADMAQRSTGQLMQMFGIAGQQAQDRAEETTRNIQAITQSSMVLIRGFQDVSREWLDMSRDRIQKNLDSLNALTRCRSMQDVAALQSSVVRDNLELTIENVRGLAKLSLDISDEAARSINEPTERRRSRAA